jgi:hypothetical protein
MYRFPYSVANFLTIAIMVPVLPTIGLANGQNSGDIPDPPVRFTPDVHTPQSRGAVVAGKVLVIAGGVLCGVGGICRLAAEEMERDPGGLEDVVSAALLKTAGNMALCGGLGYGLTGAAILTISMTRSRYAGVGMSDVPSFAPVLSIAPRIVLTLEL